jgi:hypothetical protein
MYTKVVCHLHYRVKIKNIYINDAGYYSSTSFPHFTYIILIITTTTTTTTTTATVTAIKTTTKEQKDEDKIIE